MRDRGGQLVYNLNMLDFGTMLLKGFSQIFFQENILMGILIVIGLAIASPIALALALIGGASSALVGKFLGYDPGLYAAGVAAFNGIMIGCAMSFYFKSVPFAVVATVLGSLIGGVLFFLLSKYGITPYALPFVFVTFATVFIAKFYGI